ncbi:MAG: hypothetical protein QNJ45_27000 [Ardenticatenaceae bacterium]|nr:hypothetical protein [Ardenticatenaceae bacterium]
MILRKMIKWPTAAVLLVGAFTLQYFLISEYLPRFLEYSKGLLNPDQLFWYSAGQLEQLYLTLGAPGRKFYQSMLRLDFFYATFAGLGYSLLLYLLSKNTRWKMIFVVPLLMTFFDYFENLAQLYLLQNFPEIDPGIALLSAASSFLKLTSSGIGIFLVIGFVGRAAYFGIRNLQR